MTIHFPDLAAMFPNYAWAWYIFLIGSLPVCVAYLAYRNIEHNNAKPALRLLLLWAVVTLGTIAAQDISPGADCECTVSEVSE